MKVTIIGAGPAGLITALQLAKAGITVSIIDKNEQIGGKLPISGGGRCNFSHAAQAEQLRRAYGQSGQFLKHAFKAFDPQRTRRYFAALGITSYVAEDGRVFPTSNRAADVVLVFAKALQRLGVLIYSQCAVTDIKYDTCWQITTDKAVFKADNLVIATGGRSYPTLGTSGDALQWFEALQLAYRPLKPALTPVAIDGGFSELAGLTIDQCLLSIYRGASKIVERRGALLLTHRGLSGPLALNISRYFENGDVCYVNWLGRSERAVEQEILTLCEQSGKRSLSAAFVKLGLPQALNHYIMMCADVEPQKKCAELTRSMRKSLIAQFCRFRLVNPQLLGFNKAMVTRGGLSLDELSAKSFAVKRYQGLYAIGEVVDIDGDSGGYNIQAALSMGYLAAQAIIAASK